MKTMNFKHLFLLLLSLGLLTSCEDVVDVKLNDASEALVVDGWIYHEVLNPNGVPDTIHLKLTAPYFTNKALPRATGAFVTISSNFGQTDTLLEIRPGKYITQKLDRQIGQHYTLDILYKGEHYQSNSFINRVPPIDSLKTVYQPKDGLIEEGYYLYYFGPEPAGKGDRYRFKIYRNHVLLNGIQDMIVADDRFLTDGQQIDSLQIGGQGPPKYFFVGDTVTCEIVSLTEEALNYYIDVLTQIQNQGLFAPPLSNIRFNVYNVNKNSDKKVVGIFGAGAMYRKEVVVVEKK